MGAIRDDFVKFAEIDFQLPSSRFVSVQFARDKHVNVMQLQIHQDDLVVDTVWPDTGEKRVLARAT